MKRIIILTLALGMLFSIPPLIAAQKVGVGFILGEPTGLSFKYWTSTKTAFDAAIAWSLGDENAFHVHFDYLVHNYNVLRIESQRVVVYYGIGGRIRENGKDHFGARFPLGISYIFRKIPIEIFLEIVPIFDFAPKTEFNMNGGIGFRYIF